ncbi:hypothetical protein C4D60_Mb08t02250 [Musa balbisiana]|uniref:Uncharacterized protein n=1 Tax=Musa balbisiana TaxID=52838 RepID=A0A4S8K0Q8_MUSBA|nr:hypothetical protein C4D60_Mb08t02250 [Musa balbisiana]
MHVAALFAEMARLMRCPRWEMYDGDALTAFVVRLHVSAAFVFAVVMSASVDQLRHLQDDVKDGGVKSFDHMLQRNRCGFRKDV